MNPRDTYDARISVRSTTTTIRVVLLALAALATFADDPRIAAADDWPRWRGPRGVSLVEATGTGARKLAQFRLLDGDQNWATPLVFRGKVYLKGASEPVAIKLP